MADVLRHFIRRNIAIENEEIDIKPVTSEGANYTSKLYKIKVTSPKHDLNLFAKVANVCEGLRAKFDADQLYQTERFVYTELVKVYEELQDNNQVPEEHRFRFPKCFGCHSTSGEEIVVMEDLVAAGCYTYDRFRSLDWEHAASGVTSLAKFHALSFAYQKHAPKSFKDLVDNRKFFSFKPNEESEKFFKERVRLSAEKIASEQNREKVYKVFSDPDVIQKFKKPLSTPVLVHGDYRTSNLLFKIQDNKIETLVVDFQTLQLGSPASDLIYFVFLGTDRQFRDAHYEALVDRYYEELTLALERLNVDPEEVYSRTTFDEEVKEMLPYAIFISVAVLPIVLVEAELAPRVDLDDSIDGFMVKSTDLYEERLNGIVDDCVRWGAL